MLYVPEITFCVLPVFWCLRVNRLFQSTKRQVVRKSTIGYFKAPKDRKYAKAPCMVPIRFRVSLVQSGPVRLRSSSGCSGCSGCGSGTSGSGSGSDSGSGSGIVVRTH